MDEDRIREIIQTLDMIGKSGDGKSHLATYGPPNELFLTASQVGLLRLARTLLQTAIDPIPKGDSRSPPMVFPEDVEQARGEPVDYALTYIQRMEAWPEPAEAIKRRLRRSWGLDRAALLGCGIFGFLVLFILIAGIIAIWSVLTQP